MTMTNALDMTMTNALGISTYVKSIEHNQNQTITVGKSAVLAVFTV